MLRGFEEILECVESNLILLHISIDQNHALNPVVYGVADEIVVQDELFTENKAEISAAQELVDEGRISAHQLVEDVLQNRTHSSERERVELLLLLDLSVHKSVMRKFFHRHSRFILDWPPEHRKRVVAILNHKLQVHLSEFFIENEMLLSAVAQPIDQR